MRQVEKQDRLNAGGAHKAGWLVSLVLHGSLVLGAMVLLQQMQLAVLEKPFEWNVAMVQPAAIPHSPTAANESPPTPPPPRQSQVLAPRPPEPAPVQPLPSPVLPAPPPPIHTPITPPRAEPAPFPPIQAAAPSKPEPTPEPVRDQPRPQSPVAMKSPEAPPTTALADIPPPAHSVSPPEPASASAPASTATSVPEPAPSAPEPVRTEVDLPHQPVPTPGRTADTSTATQQSVTPAAPEIQPGQTGTAKPDDGWLSALMGRWITDLEKHYPATLRLEGVQGKVVLVAMLHENGTLTDVKIAKSSGNTVLDQAAIADVEQGPPIKLSRPLGRPQRPIKFSISYDLKTAR